MNTNIRNFLQEEDGVTALEYGILAAVVAVIIATAFHDALEGAFTTLFTKITSTVNGVSD